MVYDHKQQFARNPDYISNQPLPGFASDDLYWETQQQSPVNPNWVEPQQNNLNHFK